MHFTHAHNRLLTFLHNLYELLLIGGIESNPGPLDTKLTISHANINSITTRDRLDELSQFTDTNDIDIVCLTETKLDDTVHSSLYILPGYTEPLTRHRTRHGGGVALYTKSNLAVRRLSDLESGNIEWIWAQVKIGNSTVIVCCIYMPPDPTAQEQLDFCDQLKDSVLKAQVLAASCIVLVGDLNAGNIFISNPSSPHSGISAFDRLLFDTYAELDMHQIIHEPTRKSPSCSNLRDQIAVSDCDSILASGTLSPFSNIDHEPVYVKLNIETPQANHNTTRIVWDYVNMDPELLTNILMNTNWDTILQQDLDRATHDFTHTILNAASQAIPKKHITIRDSDKSWMTCTLKRFIRKRERLYRKAKATDSPHDWERWRQQRNATSNLNKRLKQSFLTQRSQRLITEKQNPCKYHAILKQMIGKRKTSEIPPLLKADGELATDDKEKAELLNVHFAKQSTSENFIDPSPRKSNAPELSNIVVTIEEVLRELNSLKVNKSCGPDELPNKIIKLVTILIYEPLTILFNKSLSEGKFPSGWKEAKVTAIFKRKGSPSQPTNYRPISLLPCLSKVFERLVFKQIYQHLINNRLLSETQSGYRPSHSTQLQLIYLSHKLYEALDDNLAFTIVYLDVAKYFDRIPHKGLLFKCEHLFGISGNLLKWLASYLTDRIQRVLVGNELSEQQKIGAGCPQGSVMGPLLALMYLNDIGEVTTSPTLLFADDTAIFLAHEPNSREAVSQLQLDLDNIVQFGKMWGITFNAQKTVQQTFYTKTLGQTPRLSFDGQPITIHDSHKHLGVTFSTDLRFHKHINEVICKINKSLGPLYAVADYLPRNTLNLIYKIYLRPIFDYCDVVYDSNLTVTDAMRLERLQLKIARLVTGAHFRSPTNDLLTDVGWETLKTRRTLHKLTEFYKINDERITTPEYLTRITLPTRSQETRRTLRNANNITTHRHRLTLFRNSFFPDSTHKWNSLSIDTRNQPNLKSFRKAVAHHYDVKKPERYFSLGTKLGNKLNTRMRLKTSALNAHLFRIGLTQTPQCRCGYKNEGSAHFILFCPNFAHPRSKLMQGLVNVFPEFINMSDNTKLEILLKGSFLDKKQKAAVADSFQSFLIGSRRFLPR